MEIVQKRQYVECVKYVHHYEWAHLPGAGFSFECDEDGRIDRSEMHPHAIVNLENCIRGENEQGLQILDYGVERRSWGYWEPAVGKCENCKSLVTLDGFTNTCDGCGADYNSSGQRLAPRSQWGEETGESLGDILRIP